MKKNLISNKHAHTNKKVQMQKNRCESLNEQPTCMILKQKGASSKRLIIKKGQRHYFLMKKIGKKLHVK